MKAFITRPSHPTAATATLPEPGPLSGGIIETSSGVDAASPIAALAMKSDFQLPYDRRLQNARTPHAIRNGSQFAMMIRANNDPSGFVTENPDNEVITPANTRNQSP